jgi:hypothetical protein
MAMHYVYILESLTVPGHFYIGSTENLREAFENITLMFRLTLPNIVPGN